MWAAAAAARRAHAELARARKDLEREEASARSAKGLQHLAAEIEAMPEDETFSFNECMRSVQRMARQLPSEGARDTLMRASFPVNEVDIGRVGVGPDS